MQPSLVYPQFAVCSRRLKSYGDLWYPDGKPPKEDLAALGFVFLDIKDLTACVFCGQIESQWKPNENILERHFRNYPDCSARRQGFYLPSHLFPKAMETAFPEYRDLQRRENTFENWPIQLAQKPSQMARAGFFYSGQADLVVCFLCGGRIQGWNAEESPTRQHFQLFPKCPFIQAHVDGVSWLCQTGGTGTSVVDNIDSYTTEIVRQAMRSGHANDDIIEAYRYRAELIPKKPLFQNYLSLLATISYLHLTRDATSTLKHRSLYCLICDHETDHVSGATDGAELCAMHVFFDGKYADCYECVPCRSFAEMIGFMEAEPSFLGE